MVTERGRGLFYAPSPPPQSGDAKAVAVWCGREFERIALAMREGASEWLRFDVLTKKPVRPVDGMVAFFAANAVSGGSAMGSYEYKAGSWTKL
jgi:hypothetical protein